MKKGKQYLCLEYFKDSINIFKLIKSKQDFCLGYLKDRLNVLKYKNNLETKLNRISVNDT